MDDDRKHGHGVAIWISLVAWFSVLAVAIALGLAFRRVCITANALAAIPPQEVRAVAGSPKPTQPQRARLDPDVPELAGTTLFALGV